jgi:hypothetical protein
MSSKWQLATKAKHIKVNGKSNYLNSKRRIFVDGKRVMDGLGVLEFPDGSVYRGQFDKDRM